MVARYGVRRWFLIGGSVLGMLGAPSCLLSFDQYAEGDVCDAGRDAGVRFRTAPDPVLRGCDAGRAPDQDSAGSSGAAGSPDAADASSAGAANGSSAGDSS